MRTAKARERARWVRGLVWLLAVGLGGCSSCGSKKEEEPPIAPQPPRGAASSDELTTGLGQAKGLAEELAPTSAKWRRVFVLDDKRAILAGEVVNQAVALITEDAGRTWQSIKVDRDAWAGWSAGLDGSLALGAGARDGAATGSATIEAARLMFAALDAPTLTAPTPLFPTAKGPAKGLFQTENATPALLAAGSAALIGEEKPRHSFVFYGGKPGAEAVAPLKLPSSEKFVPVPYGRPPVLLSIKGRDLLYRPFPAPGKPLDKPAKVAGVTATPGLLGELSTLPLCDSAGWSFQRVKQAKGLRLLGFAGDKVVDFALPESTLPTTRIGCGVGKIVIEAVQAKTGAPALWASQPDIPILVTCDLKGKCVTPQNPAFRVWPEKHEREIAAAPTEQGILGVLTSRAGNHWGIYLAQASDGTIYERPRVVGEGNGDRGQIEVGAFFSFGKRALLLISADVTGTSRRGWFVIVSDDGGTTWNPP